MGNDGEDSGRSTKPVASLRPFARALHHMEQGEPSKIDPADVEADIREHGVSALPAELESWLCDYLAGSIETRGRKGESPLERRVVGLHASQCYDAIRKAQRGDPDVLPEAVRIIRPMR